VANRGEIALRIIRAAHELGMEAVAVYSDADVDAPFTAAADLMVRLGPAAPAESYLSVERIIDAARQTGAEALHPGYGFLSERPELAEACARAGIVFVGPGPATLAGLGDKLAARRAARQAGVPVVPGTLEPIAAAEPAAVEALAAEADSLGWPLLVKAAAGGGGRGMRRVEGRRELPEAVAAASHEALAAFGDGSVYLERLISPARHVEVQLLGDRHDSVVALGERDCSVQRRHQKLVEEAPAPGLEPGQRRELHERAVAVARAVGLENAATAEFLLDEEGAFWFLEVNARLQVEHGVTELVTGLDLVHEQFRIAAGAPLTPRVLAAAASAADPDRHAIEVRISAEDPGRGFAPTPGRVTRWAEPAGPGVRVDSGVREGSQVPMEYDPLLAKLMVVAPERPSALARLARALEEFQVGGIQTTLPFHRWLVGSEPFGSGRLSIELVEREWQPEASREPALQQAMRLAAAAYGGSPAPASIGRDGRSAGGWQQAARLEQVERWPR
jgi:acetyl/propionyl-CoA carboxylase alpha subunit